jgi:16S rRNA (guanine1207-N2)-methyltransferase
MIFTHVYGAPPSELAALAANAQSYDPLTPGAARLEDVAPGSLDNLAVLAPPGAVERRYTLALALRALKHGAPLLALAPKDRGGGRIAGELEALGCASHESSKKHHRICQSEAAFAPEAVEAALAEGAPRFDSDLGLWTQPGVFSWDRIDAGTRALLRHLPDFSGSGADFGCGLGILAHRVLTSEKVKALVLVDLDRRAVDLCARNVVDPRVAIRWADIRDLSGLPPLDFIVMNAPFHEAGRETKALGVAFIEKAAKSLRTGGACWLVANRHLPYEAALEDKFRSVAPVAEAAGFKVIEAVK